jgi:methyltransferase
MILEFNFGHSHKELNILNYYFLVFFILLQLGRVWVLISLGKYWTTRVFRVRGKKLIRKGPYRFLKHPNYIIVILEIATLPLIFNLYYTAIIFTVLNAIMLTIRINVENKALSLE